MANPTSIQRVSSSLMKQGFRPKWRACADGRYRPEEIERHGFAYTSVGRGTTLAGQVAEAAE
ncbi:hypothetical protein SAMN05192571_1126 [Pleomorphomonas diazotrophica]|nr:hypothetical protein SAMN05192571_1126 [Pleomorphomonas diazotrophica]